MRVLLMIAVKVEEDVDVGVVDDIHVGNVVADLLRADNDDDDD